MHGQVAVGGIKVVVKTFVSGHVSNFNLLWRTGLI